jgi:hypothetical protein
MRHGRVLLAAGRTTQGEDQSGTSLPKSSQVHVHRTARREFASNHYRSVVQHDPAMSKD